MLLSIAINQLFMDGINNFSWSDISSSKKVKFEIDHSYEIEVTFPITEKQEIKTPAGKAILLPPNQILVQPGAHSITLKK